MKLFSFPRHSYKLLTFPSEEKSIALSSTINSPDRRFIQSMPTLCITLLIKHFNKLIFFFFVHNCKPTSCENILRYATETKIVCLDKI